MKRWWKSKTIWIQIATAVIGGLEATQAVQVVPADWQGALFITLAALNAFIRFRTTEAVK